MWLDTGIWQWGNQANVPTLNKVPTEPCVEARDKIHTLIIFALAFQSNSATNLTFPFGRLSQVQCWEEIWIYHPLHSWLRPTCRKAPWCRAGSPLFKGQRLWGSVPNHELCVTFTAYERSFLWVLQRMPTHGRSQVSAIDRCRVNLSYAAVDHSKMVWSWEKLVIASWST